MSETVDVGSFNNSLKTVLFKSGNEQIGEGVIGTIMGSFLKYKRPDRALYYLKFLDLEKEIPSVQTIGVALIAAGKLFLFLFILLIFFILFFILFLILLFFFNYFYFYLFYYFYLYLLYFIIFIIIMFCIFILFYLFKI